MSLDIIQQFSIARITAIAVIISFYIYGHILRVSLHHGNECDMTWSVVRFIHIPEENADGPVAHNATQENDPKVVQDLKDPFKSAPASTYRLMKFIDGRDERYKYLIDYERPYKSSRGESSTKSQTFNTIKGEDWCQSANFDVEDTAPHGHIVIYVPGHSGQYMQARSLAAHGINLSQRSSNEQRQVVHRTLERLWDGTMNASPEGGDVNDFVYDVFTVYFDGEGGGLHGSRLFAQAEFLANSIERIARQCGEENITIVAHSIGGIVARMASTKVNERRMKENENPMVRNIITLASPHASIPLIFDRSVHNFHRFVETKEERLKVMQQGREINDKDYIYNVVSISGGIRDELIPPEACEISGDRSISLMSTNVMAPRFEIDYTERHLGMDHNAIVWCNGLLKAVREMIFIMVSTSQSDKDNSLEHISEFIDVKRTSMGSTNIHECNFECEVERLQILLQEEYGIIGAVAIQTSMIYNCRPLIALYVINGLFYLIAKMLPTRRTRKSDGWCLLIIPFLASGAINFVKSDLNGYHGFATTLVLAYVAMSIHWCLLYGFLPGISLLRKKWRQKASNRGTETDEYLSENCCPIHTIITRQFIVSITLVLGCLALSLLAQGSLNDFELNITVVEAILFLTICTMVHLNIFENIFKSVKTESVSLFGLRQRIILITSLALSVLAVGKISFALSLTTRTGQAKAVPFMKYEQMEWNLTCSTVESLICSVGFGLIGSDLLRFTWFVCAPLYLVFVWLGSISAPSSSHRIPEEIKKDA